MYRIFVSDYRNSISFLTKVEGQVHNLEIRSKTGERNAEPKRCNMTKKLAKPNARGLRPLEKGINPETGKAKVFWLPTDEREAERRKAAIEALYTAEGVQWNAVSVHVAMAIARGDKTMIVDADADIQALQSKYPWVTFVWPQEIAEARQQEAKKLLTDRLGTMRGQCLPSFGQLRPRTDDEILRVVAVTELEDNAVEPALIDATDRAFGNGTAAHVRKNCDSLLHSLRAFKGSLHQAIDAYAKAAKEKHVSMDDGLPTEFALAEERFCGFMKRIFADMPLAKYDLAAIDSLRLTIKKRPLSYRKKPIAPETVHRLVKVLNRFHSWLHKSPDFSWRKPLDYEVERVNVQLTNAEIQERYNPHNTPIYTEEQIRILFKYATPMERVLILLALNCGFRQAEALGLQSGEYDLAAKLLARVRYKTKVYGQWRLWDVTCEALRWAEGYRPNKNEATLIQTRAGQPMGRRTKSGNRGAKIANKWASLHRRIEKDHEDFPSYPFSTLRDTGASAIRAIAGGEVAEMYLSHGNPIPDGVLLERYANKPWGRLHEALTQWGSKIGAAFKVDDAFPADYKPSNISVSKGTIEKIRKLQAQGYKVAKIAELAGCPYHIARVYAKAD